MRNAQGEMVHNYSAGDVAVSVGGGIVAVDEIHRERRLRRIVIVLDASGSMREDGGNPWQHAVMSASVLANLAEGRARLALLIFNEKIIEEVGFDRSNLAVEKRLKDLQSNREFERTYVHGHTAINDALYRAISLLASPSTADSIYAITDGYDNASRASSEDIERKLSATGVRLFANVLRPSRREGRLRETELLGLGPDFQEVALLTGGASIQADPSEAKLSFAVRRKISTMEAARLFFAAMFDNELLELRWSNPGTNKRDVKIFISETGKDHYPKTQLFYPKQLCACSSQKPN
jgi:hypothetical protein